MSSTSKRLIEEWTTQGVACQEKCNTCPPETITKPFKESDLKDQDSYFLKKFGVSYKGFSMPSCPFNKPTRFGLAAVAAISLLTLAAHKGNAIPSFLRCPYFCVKK